MTTVRTTLDSAAMQALVRDLDGPIGRMLVQKAERVRTGMIAMMPADTGRGRGSITIEYTYDGGYLIAKIGSNLEYVTYIVKGTGIYGPRGAPITPKNASVLVWKGNSPSGFVFARSVRGMKARDFMTAALNTYFEK